MRFLILSLFVLSTAPAFAALEPSEMFWRPAANQHSVTPALGYSHGEVTSKATEEKFKDNSRALSLEYAYGINETFYAGASVGYVNSNAPYSQVNGLTNLSFDFMGSSDLGIGRLVYGTNLSVSPGKSKEKSDGEYNAYSGGHQLTPMIGYEAHIAGGKMKAGGAISYDINIGDRKHVDNNGDETKFSGGEALVLMGFFEGKVSEMLTLGGSLAYATLRDTKNETAGTKTEQDDSAAISGYAVAQIQENLALLGSIGLASKEDTDTTKDDSTIVLSTGARFTF